MMGVFGFGNMLLSSSVIALFSWVSPVPCSDLYISDEALGFSVVDEVGTLQMMSEDTSKCHRPSSADDPESNNISLMDLRQDHDREGVYIRMRDAQSGIPVEVDLEICRGGKDGKELFIGTDFKFDAFSKELELHVSAKGYFYFHRAMSSPPKDGDTVDVQLNPILEGSKMTIQDIHFVADSDKFLKSSMPSLERLLTFMKLNTDVVIKVIGHVNAPGQKNSGKVKKLSKKRARAVTDYLIASGIDPSRLRYEGVGNSQMIYDNPTFGDEEAANRRVEIQIVK